MYREMLKSKLHRVTVTQSDLHYVGSVTIDKRLMERADLLKGEKVDIVNVNNGARLSTYVIEGPEDSGIIGINGAAARLVCPQDIVIIISYTTVSEADARTLVPTIVFVDSQKRIIEQGVDASHAPAASRLLRGDLLHT